ncbi:MULTISPECIES: hypothetical protein [Streptomyces]|uniref:hypothetical protein n=1 Tax=Streptomyces TaxID=1883 RepID=UPI0006B0294B|nr:hypothetical protein [Streptomyces sp. WM6349]KOU17019.1 hypothetical protein ADK49_16890 [Streptomyces sp. WM6349]
MAAAPRKDDSKPIPAGDDNATAAVQRAFDKAQEQGFFGVETDPTPNEHYTVAGVVEGKPTPETDKDAAAEARKAAGLH